MANKKAITTRAISKRDELGALLTDVIVGVGVSVEVEDDGVGEVLAEVELASMVTVCVGLQPLVESYATTGSEITPAASPITGSRGNQYVELCPTNASTWKSS